MWSPISTTIIINTFSNMKIELNISRSSKVNEYGHCPEATENQCGINYRSW